MASRVHQCIAIVLCGALSACGSSGSKSTTSGFAPVGADTFIDVPLEDETSLQVVNQDGTGYAYAVGIDDDGKFAALSALVGDDRLPAPTFAGSVKFNGTAGLLYVDRAFESQNFAIPDRFSNSVVVRVNMQDGTFSGRTEPDPVENLVFRGTVDGQGRMTGTSAFTSFDVDVSGKFEGKVSDTTAIGAFHGTDGVDLYAGGLRATR